MKYEVKTVVDSNLHTLNIFSEFTPTEEAFVEALRYAILKAFLYTQYKATLEDKLVSYIVVSINDTKYVICHREGYYEFGILDRANKTITTLISIDFTAALECFDENFTVFVKEIIKMFSATVITIYNPRTLKSITDILNLL